MSQPKRMTMDGLRDAAVAAQALYAALKDSYDLPDAGWTVCLQEPFLDVDGAGDERDGVVVFIVTVDIKSDPSLDTLRAPTHATYPIRSAPKVPQSE